ncbi:hypothetical protein OH76DRAFT_1409586 [Lentinus brumalis]|uniref:Uncharacterized protein n=1 Tax=Lentinus brumalis TaxID=2498619 RepID=A0A371CUI6_9APHY|nr:hypothetical protein OH76DRAFT_1409586 [Polyporus brumalis]
MQRWHGSQTSGVGVAGALQGASSLGPPRASRTKFVGRVHAQDRRVSNRSPAARGPAALDAHLHVRATGRRADLVAQQDAQLPRPQVHPRGARNVPCYGSALHAKTLYAGGTRASASAQGGAAPRTVSGASS